MPVPDTNTFSLQDVVDVIPGAQTSLQDCFDDSVDDFFDPTYKGSKDRLSNFRNYGGSVEMFLSYDTGYESGFVEYNNLIWATCRGAATGDSVDTVGNWEIYSTFDSADYLISRGFLGFDLSSIPATATCEEAGIGLDVTSQSGTAQVDREVIALIGTQGTTLTTADFNAFTFNTNIIMSDYDESPGDDFELFNRAIKSTGSAELGRVEALFGSYLYVALINKKYDNDNASPSGGNGITVFKAGEVDDYPEIRIVFTI